MITYKLCRQKNSVCLESVVANYFKLKIIRLVPRYESICTDKSVQTDFPMTTI